MAKLLLEGLRQGRQQSQAEAVPDDWHLSSLLGGKRLVGANRYLIKPVNPKKINSEYSLEGLMSKLMLQYFGYLMGRTDSLEKTLMLGKTVGRRRRE